MNFKYQTLNQSCSYAGLSNLLLDFEIDVEDYDIIKKASIPYIFHYDDKRDCYLAGPGLQGKKWFDLYLNKVGVMRKFDF